VHHDIATYRYIPYVESFTDNLKMCNKIEEERESFKTYMEEQRKDPVCNGLDLQALLIMPVQRLPRYT
jgi:hypothetical protein